MRMKRIAELLVLCLAMTFVFTGCSASKKSDVIIMATNAEFAPYEYYDENGEIVGIDIEIAKQLAHNMGCKLEIKDMPFETLIDALNSGKADFVIAAMTIDEERKQLVDFSTPYMDASQVVIVGDNTDITDKNNLKGKIIGVQSGTTGDDYASDISQVTIKRFTRGYDAVAALSKGNVDAVVIDSDPANEFIREFTGLTILGSVTDEQYAVAVQKGNEELLNEINKSVAAMKSSGKIDEIKEKYVTSE